MKKTLIFCTFVLACCLLCPGCSRRKLPPADLPKLWTCELDIRYEDDSPVSGALVVMNSSGKWFANGVTNSGGRAKMLTQGTWVGAASGEYTVTVRKRVVEEPPGAAQYDANGNRMGPPSKVEDFVAEEYWEVDTTPLNVSVGSAPVKETLKVKKFEKK